MSAARIAPLSVETGDADDGAEARSGGSVLLTRQSSAPSDPVIGSSKFLQLWYRYFPRLDHRSLLKYSLVLICLLTALIAVPLGRIGFAEQPFVSGLCRMIMTAIRYTCYSAFIVGIYSECFPHAFTKRQIIRNIICVSIFQVIILTPSFVLSPASVEDQNKPELSSPAFKISSLLALVLSAVSYYWYIPHVTAKGIAAWQRGGDEEKQPYDSGMDKWLRVHSSGMMCTAIITIIFGYLSLATTLYGVTGLIALSPLTLLPWAVVQCRHRNNANRIRNCAGALFLLTFHVIGMPAGAAGYLTAVFVAFRNSAGATLLILLAYNVGFYWFRLLFQHLLRMIFLSRDKYSYIFFVQLIEDAWAGLCFLGVDYTSSTFWAALAFTTTKQLIRDTTLVQDGLLKLKARLKNEPPPSLAVLRQRFERHWRLLEQNLISETTAAVLVPFVLLLDSSMSFGTPMLTAGMSAQDVWEQTIAYVILLVFELLMHAVIRRVILRKLKQLSHGVYELKEDPPSGVDPLPSPTGKDGLVPLTTASGYYAMTHGYWESRYIHFVAITIVVTLEVVVRTRAIGLVLDDPESPF
eukprot:PLAT3131.1.p1 GENE.PLAT3131.1~~PLAT3131.1.p1  ORF type:complete len:579 (+),score=200.91 PLAT3131.1:57-1793(+)